MWSLKLRVLSRIWDKFDISISHVELQVGKDITQDFIIFVLRFCELPFLFDRLDKGGPHNVEWTDRRRQQKRRLKQVGDEPVSFHLCGYCVCIWILIIINYYYY